MKTTNYGFTIYGAEEKPSWLTGFNGNMEKIDTALKVLDNKTVENEAGFEANQTAIEALQTTQSQHTQDIADIKTQVQQNKQDIASNKTSIDKMQDDLITQNTAVKQVQTDVSKLKTQQSETEIIINDITTDISTLTNESELAKNNINILTESLGNIDNIATQAKTTADTAQNTANTAKTTADTAKTTADTAKTTADKAKTNAGDAKNYAQAIHYQAINFTSNLNTVIETIPIYNLNTLKIEKNIASSGGLVVVSVNTEKNNQAVNGSIIIPLNTLNTTLKLFILPALHYNNGGSATDTTWKYLYFGIKKNGNIVTVQPTAMNGTAIGSITDLDWYISAIVSPFTEF